MWLADSGADGNIANHMSWFGTLTPCQMYPVETAGGLVTPPVIGTIKMDVFKSDGSTTQPIFKDVTYLPGCPRNLVGIGKLIKLGGYAKPGKIIYLKKGKEIELCAADDNLHLPMANKSSQSVLYANIPVPTDLADLPNLPRSYILYTLLYSTS